MNRFLYFLLGVTVSAACAMGGKSIDTKNYPIRREQQMAWVACKETYNNGRTVIPNPVGKLCTTYCPEGKLKKNGDCKKDLNVKVKNFCSPAGHNFYRNASYIFLPDSYL